MKRTLSIILCLCMLLTIIPSAFADNEAGEALVAGEAQDAGEIHETDYQEYLEESDYVEEYYVDGDTVYDLENEVDTPPVPDKEPPSASFIEEEENEDIYNDFSFEAENAAQLQGEHVLDEIIIKFKEPWQVPGKEKQLQHEIEKVEKVGFVESLGVYVVKVDEFNKNPNAVLNRFKNNKYIEYVEPNYIVSMDSIPNDPNYKGMSIVLNLLNAPAGWDIIQGSNLATIAVVDSGVVNHPDLPPLLSGYSAVGGLSPNNDSKGHGTGVAGTLGAVGNNNLGGVGINWNAAILSVKVDDASGTMSVANVAKGIIWAADNGAQIINLSLGTTSDSTTLKNAIDYAYNKGCAIFAATGNDGNSSISYPARYSNVMAVGSTSNGTSRVGSSNYGSGMGVVAYGSYNTTTASGSYAGMAGTSFASPQVAGLASLIWALNPKLTNDEVYRLIEQGAKTLGGGYNEQTGYGLIDIGKTLQLAGGIADPEPQITESEPTPDTTEESTLPAQDENPLADLPSEVKSFITEAATGTRNDYNGSVGYEFECLTDMTVSYVGRPWGGAMNQSHTVYIWEVNTMTLLASATVGSDSPLDGLGYKIAQLDKPVNLHAGEKYRIVSSETTGGDRWYDVSQSYNLIPTGDCQIITPVYTDEGAHLSYPKNTYNPGGVKGYVGVTFYYAVSIPETPQETRTAPVITLTGFSDLILEYGQAYNEMGYSAADCKGVDLTGAVKITNTVDIWKAGLYTITYEVADSAGLTARATRTVTVNPKPADPPPSEAPKITIIGSNPIVLHQTSGTPYKEQMARAVDYDGTDISSLVTVLGTVNRSVAGTYMLTYSITSPTTGLTATTTRNVRIVSPTQKKDPRTPYGFSGQAKAGAKVTHTGIVSSAVGFMDLNVSSIDKNMTITVQLINTATNKAVVTDTFSATGTKQYKIDQSKYELAVTIDKANGNSKYSIDLLMPETAVIEFFDEEEVPLSGLPQIAPIGSNPIILHIGGTPYFEQGARAVDYLGEDISDRVVIEGAPDTSVAGTYTITYKVVGAMGVEVIATREVRIIDPNTEEILEQEVPLSDLSMSMSNTITYVVVSGDSLSQIARKQYGDVSRWREIYDMNKGVVGSDPNRIYVGQVLTIKAE